MQLGQRAVPALLAMFLLLVGAPAHGDKVSGTWTGVFELRGNYYLEQNTRVIAPETRVTLEAPNGTQVQVNYLIDVITSASQAAGALEDVRFNEVRHDVGVGGGHEFDVGEQQLRVDAEFRVSKEPDYLSTSGFLAGQLFLAQRATVLSSSIGVLHDEVRQNFRGGTGIRPGAAFREDFNGIALSVGWEQVLTPRLTTQLSYDYGFQTGYLANAYRRVGDGRAESHPGKRRRHTLSGRLAYYIPKTGTSLQLLYRAYTDSWDIRAINPEARIYQEVGRYVQLRGRYRFYRQTKSFFARPGNDHAPDEVLLTADPKMQAFRLHEAGLQIVILAEFLRGRSDWLAGASVDLNVSRIWSSSAFGNGWVALAGAKFPF